MSAAYDELLEATIQHLEDLKSRGVRHLAVSPETLRTLAQPVKFHIADFRPQAERADAPRTIARSPQFSKPPVPAAVSDVREPPPADRQVRPTSRSVPPVVSNVREPEPASEKAIGISLAPPGETVAGPLAALDPQARAAAFALLRERALGCQKCPHLASSRKTVVFGVGNPDAQLMFVGEAPGADEDERGEPFVGRAGELLTKIIQATGLQRSEVYIANILKCRPDTPGEASGNRKPRPEEMATCIPYLHEQIDLIRPKVLVALGATAVEGLLGKTVGITKLRGNWKTYRGIPLMPTYHPAYLLRNQAMTEKRKVWEDMLAVMEKLEMPISTKQRNYFLRS